MPFRLLACFEILPVLLAILVVSTASLFGAEVKINPLVTIKEEYNDNIYFSSDDDSGELQKEEDFITTLSGGIAVQRRTERTDLALRGRADRLMYGKHDTLNDWEHYLNGRFSLNATSRVNLFTDAEYQRQTRRDRDLDYAGVITETNEPSYRQHYGLGGDHTLTSKIQLTVAYDFDRHDYDDPDSYDIRSQGINLGLIRSLNLTTAGRFNLGYVQYSLSNSYQGAFPYLPLPFFLVDALRREDSTVRNYTTTIGVSYAFSEKITLLADIGARYTTSDMEIDYLPSDALPPYSQESDDKGVGTIGQLQISYSGERTRGSLSAYRDISAAGGSYGTTERTSVSLQIDRRFTYDLSGNVSFNYYVNQSDAGEISPQEVDEDTYTITPSLRCRLSDDITMEAQYQYTAQQDREDDTEAERSLFFFRLSYEFPLLD